MKTFKKIIKEIKQIGNKFQLEDREEHSLATYIADRFKAHDAAKSAQDAGKFSKLGMIINIARWYDQKGFLTSKQLDVLKKAKIIQ